PHLDGLLIGAGAAAVLAALAAFLLSRAISRPVRRVAEATRALAQEQSPTAVPVEGARELAVLAQSFNDLAVQLARARAAERSFLLSVSHELKTPLTAIRGYAEGLAEGAVPSSEAAETIGREAARLERLVRDLLDLARMNKSEFSVRREPIDLGAVAREAVLRYEAHARSFGVDLEAFAADPAPAIGDADRMLQIVSNLVENALRVTPPAGGVRVLATPGKIAVEDTGPGLRPEELPRAFERFYLYSRYGAERAVGTGLGLAIVKELAEGMGGTVEVTSVPGRRTTFAVRLPAPEAVLPAAYEPTIAV
ncbi:MAG: HAMP domain-containing sensor histidine kinase, partial [Gaiellaceae bacterium]